MLATLLLCLGPSGSSLQKGPDTGGVELDMRMRGAMPAVELRVNGEGPFLFAIDTCASGPGRADASLVRRLGLTEVGRAAGGDGSGRSAPMSVVAIESLELGGLDFGALELPSRDYDRPDLPHIDGILGYGLFTKGVLTLDFPARKVRYDPAASLPEPDGQHVLALEAGSVASLPIEVGGRTVSAHLDTGNLAGRFVFPGALVSEMTLLEEPRAVGRARTVAGEIDILQVRIQEPISFGVFEFAGETITYPSPGATANVGASVLGTFRLSLDPSHRRVRFERS